MHLTILGATGATGLELTRQALGRDHRVTAIARHPERIAVEDSERLVRVAGDVRDPASIAAALTKGSVVLSGLGQTAGDQPGVLTAGARAVVAATPHRILWLGAFGTGSSAAASGWATRALVRAFLGSEIADKVTADGAVLEAGGTVFHAGPLSNAALSSTRRTVGLDAAPRRLFPARVSRATVAALMLDEAENPRYPAATAVPCDR
jgi:uncharacterized protein